MLPIVFAIVAFAAIMLIVLGLAGGQSVDPVQARLTQLGSMQAKNLEELELQQPFFDRTMRPFMKRLSAYAQRITSPASASRAEKRLAQAGNPGNLKAAEFTALKLVSAVVVSALALLIFGVLGGNVAFGLVSAVVGLGLGFILPEYWLNRRIRARNKAILLAIPDTLDLLTISVRAGLGFDAALGRVVEKTTGPLSDEFRRGLAEIRLGTARRDALRGIVARTNVPALANFIGAIIQAETLGVSISKVLQVQSEQLRIERRQRAEEAAAKAPIKMLFPLVGCIFPSLFIVILGPAIILLMVNLKT